MKTLTVQVNGRDVELNLCAAYAEFSLDEFVEMMHKHWSKMHWTRRVKCKSNGRKCADVHKLEVREDVLHFTMTDKHTVTKLFADMDKFNQVVLTWENN